MLSVSLLCLVHQPGGMKHDISFPVLLLSYVAPHSTPFLIPKQPQQPLTTGPGMCTRGGARQENRRGCSVSPLSALSTRHPKIKAGKPGLGRHHPSSLCAGQCYGQVRSCCAFKGLQNAGELCGHERWGARVLSPLM